jgi:hypothetical protein
MTGLGKNTNLMSNERLGCTVIYNEKEVYYNVGVRLKSSQRGRPAAARVGFNLGFHAGQLFRGVHKTVSIDRSEGQITGAQEICIVKRSITICGRTHRIGQQGISSIFLNTVATSIQWTAIQFTRVVQ